MSNKILSLNQTVPFSPFVTAYTNFGGCGVVSTYNGWRPETNSWKKSCYISANLSGLMCVHTVKGPDAVKMMDENFVNNFTKMPVGAVKHGIMVTGKGHIIEHGVVVRVAEDTFDTYAFQPYINFVAERGNYDVTITATPMGDFIYQLAGPRSLEILENACKKDLHDLKFMRFCQAEIAGHKVRITRMGMGGTLSYEVHGPQSACDEVYNKIIEAGTAYGIEKLGWLSYQCNHTENGFPQIGQHFPYPFDEEEGFDEYQRKIGFLFDPLSLPTLGTLSDDIHDYYRNPIEVGWEKMVRFDHDFHGREALEKIAASRHREVTTLEWNSDDIISLFASNFKEYENNYKQFPLPFDQEGNGFGNSQDKVINANGEMVGISMQPIFTDYYKKVISLCVIDPEYKEIGKDVTVLWGNKGNTIKEIHAKIARYPYLDLTDNRHFDIESIPRYNG
ncbi:MAG: aminomethyl transferase family protein [Clostridiales bacterium]|nr:aminomethyl transferase family protein [Clostridiales bacterium]MCC8106024.1 aminomethyl transferase family protein [Clostridiales bacterium]